ncbi:hypothetical protein [Streptomyces bullii]|uniref:Uncharacterized protein n=1 Tax=Streptomyces bullii TaxID=349910 RepID=A0ABW0USZ2_9ACTN
MTRTGAPRRGVVGALQQVDAGLEHRAAAPVDADPPGDLRDGQIARVTTRAAGTSRAWA